MKPQCWQFTFSVSDGASQDLSAALDLLDYTTLELMVRVTQATTGDSPRLLLRHAPVNEADAYDDFPTPIAVDLTATGRTWVHVGYFTRWLAWFSSGTLDADAEVVVDLIARA